MYKEILFFPNSRKDQYLGPEDARQILGSALGGNMPDPLLFTRDEHGQSLQLQTKEKFGSLPPAVMIAGGRGLIRMYGVGQTGANLLNTHAMALLDALQQKEGVTRFEMRKGEMTLHRFDGPIPYSLSRIVLSKRLRAKSGAQRGDGRAFVQDFWEQPIEVFEADLKEEIKRSIELTAGWLDNDLQTSQGASLLAKLPENVEDWDIAIHEGEFVAIPVKPGVYAAGFKNVVVTLGLELNGPWAAGKLRSRGYGIIRRKVF